MIKTMALIIAVSEMLSLSVPSGETQKQSKTLPAGNIRTVTINCPGKCVLNNTSQNGMVLNATMSSTGSIYGIKSISSTPLDIITNQYNDSLVISTTPLSTVFTFGISTYRETQELNVSLPASVTVVYANCEKELTAELSKQNIADVYCNAKKSVIVEGGAQRNNQDEKHEVELFGAGKQYYSLLAENIRLKLKEQLHAY